MEVKWLGHTYSGQVMSSDPKKVITIQKWQEPEDKEAVKSFLQTEQFVATYMRSGHGETYSDITKPQLRKDSLCGQKNARKVL